jgi:hypothetical protein
MREEAVDSDAQLKGRVGESLQPGETLRAVVWASRADGRTSLSASRAEISPFRLRFRRPEPDGPGARKGVQGAPRSLAVGLDQHIRIVTHPRVLALTDRRLLVLSKRVGSWRDVFRPAEGTVPALRLLWECPRKNLKAATERDGRLRLAFIDGSAVTLLTPAAGIQAFLKG